MKLIAPNGSDDWKCARAVRTGGSTSERVRRLTRNCDVALELTISTMLQCYSQSPCALWFLVSLVGVVKSRRHPNLLHDVNLCPVVWNARCLDIGILCFKHHFEFLKLDLPFLILQDYIKLGDLDENIYEVTKIGDGNEKLWEFAANSHDSDKQVFRHSVYYSNSIPKLQIVCRVFNSE